MSVDIALTKDKISKNGASARRTAQRNTNDFNKFVKIIGKSTGHHKNDLRVFLKGFVEAIASRSPQGCEIETPIGTFLIEGQSQDSEKRDIASPKVREIKTEDTCLRARANHDLAKRIRLESSIIIADAPSMPAPSITRVEIADSGDGAGSPERILRIVGNRLSFDIDDQELGVFLFGHDDSVEATRMASYSRNGYNIVEGRLSGIKAGLYRLELRTRPAGSDIRVGCYDEKITVV
jgi:hypothetical protein